MPAAGPPTPKSPARGSRPKTESGKTSANHASRRASNPEIPGPRFAPENRKREDEREPWRPPGLQLRNPPAQGSRPKTENKGLAGSRARTVPAAGPPTLKLPARGSRPETENGESSANRVGRRASNLETPGPRFAPGNRNRGDESEPCRPPGLQLRNSRPEVRARKPKSGRRARTVVATGPPTPKSPARGSRPKTESGKTSANHGGRRDSNSEIPRPRVRVRKPKTKG